MKLLCFGLARNMRGYSARNLQHSTEPHSELASSPHFACGHKLTCDMDRKAMHRGVQELFQDHGISE